MQAINLISLNGAVRKSDEHKKDKFAKNLSYQVATDRY